MDEINKLKQYAAKVVLRVEEQEEIRKRKIEERKQEEILTAINLSREILKIFNVTASSQVQIFELQLFDSNGFFDVKVGYSYKDIEYELFRDLLENKNINFFIDYDTVLSFNRIQSTKYKKSILLKMKDIFSNEFDSNFSSNVILVSPSPVVSFKFEKMYKFLIKNKK